MKLQATNNNGFTLIEILESRIDAINSPELRLKAKELSDKGVTRIILDLSNVTFMDSSGLGTLVSILKMLGTEGDLIISGATGIVADLFQLTRMDRVFRMCTDKESAKGMMVAA